MRLRLSVRRARVEPGAPGAGRIAGTLYAIDGGRCPLRRHLVAKLGSAQAQPLEDVARHRRWHNDIEARRSIDLNQHGMNMRDGRHRRVARPEYARMQVHATAFAEHVRRAQT